MLPPLPSLLLLLLHLLHLPPSHTHATLTHTTALPPASTASQTTTWNMIKCQQIQLRTPALPALYAAFAADCYRALGKLPPPTILPDDFLLPTVIHSGSCAVSVERHSPHDATPPPRDPVLCMHAEIWPRVRALGREMVAACVARHRMLSGYVPTRTRCEEGAAEHAYTVRVRVATPEQRARAPIHFDRTPHVGGPARRSPPRQIGKGSPPRDRNGLDFGSLYADEDLGSLGF